MALRLFLAAMALAAVIVGLLLPVPGRDRTPRTSQIATYELGAN
jgi:hypothetical protein